MAGELFYDNNLYGNLIYREYLATKLTSPLINNQKYFITYYLKLADSVRYATKSMGVLFTQDSIHKNTYDTISATPQINFSSVFFTSKSWMKIRGSFITNGTEKYMYIGNFSPHTTNDTLFVNGGRKNLFNYPYYYFDDICVSTDSLYSEDWVTSLKENNNKNFNIYPNPASDFLFVENISQDIELRIFDIMGTEFKIKRNEFGVDLMNFESGVYYIKFATKEKKTIFYKIIKQ